MHRNESADEFPGLRSLQRLTGVSAENLLSVLKIECDYHWRILSESDAQRRQELYAELYSAVHPLLAGEQADATQYERLARLFERECAGKSILDVGCGDASLLRSLALQCKPASLLGLDVFPFPAHTREQIQVSQGDIVEFELATSVEVIISSQVIEHISPADANRHLRSISKALVTGGHFIVVTPNRLWGPHDITRVYDCTNTNAIAAEGSHFSEYTYRELMDLLTRHGFENVKTVVPFAERLPLTRHLRIRPTLNLFIEKSQLLRSITYWLKWNGRAIFKNPIVLVARKA